MKANLNKTAEEQLNLWGFTQQEVEHLGLVSLDRFNEVYSVDLSKFNISNLKWLYRELMTNQDRYKPFAEWLKKRFDKYIEINTKLRIYVGGEKQFLVRGDKELEKSLKNISKALEKYVSKGECTPKRISTLFYYLNLMF